MTTGTVPQHGELRRYKAGCRCPRCTAANAAHQRYVYREQAYGRWQPFIPAEPIRAHIRTLQAHKVGLRRIAALAGVHQTTLSKILYTLGDRPPTRQVKQETAAAILSVRPGLASLADGALVDATGTRRRIQALALQGFPYRFLGPLLDVHPKWLSNIHRDRHVTAHLARTAMRVYDRLWNADPVEHGVPSWSASRVRTDARGKGWAPALAWDDDTIEDPAARPDYGSPSNRPGATLAEIEWLMECGETNLTVIAARIGVTPAAVERALYRAEARARWSRRAAA